MKLLYPSLCLLAMSVACGPADPSSLSHDPGRFINSASSFQWRAISEETYRSSESDILPSDDARAIKFQAWADKIRQVLLLSSPEIASAPRPLVRLAENPSADAHTATVNVCIERPMTLDISSTSAVEEDASYLQAKQYLTAASRRDGCEVVEGTAAASLAFMKWALRSVKNCQVSLSGETLVLSSACGQSVGQDNFAGFQTEVTHNYVTLNTGLVDQLSEAEVIAALAHELGHYYMGHATADAPLYNYYYARAGKNPSKKPIALEAGDPLHALAMNVQDAIFGAGDATAIEDLIAEATAKGIGYYTIEQEADDLATEVVARLGLGRQAVVSMALSLGAFNSASNIEACRLNYASGFKSPVWIGDLNDPHHDFCYRAFNSYGEILAHALD